jgi:hypothetical protein
MIQMNNWFHATIFALAVLLVGGISHATDQTTSEAYDGTAVHQCSIQGGWVSCGVGSEVYDQGCRVSCGTKSAVCQEASASPIFDPNNPGGWHDRCDLWPSYCYCR